ncbi:MAG: galactokinase [Ilumatobacteraceae bacterium]
MGAGDARRRAITRHRNVWGPADILARAPGRVNLIGEHTDYNDGFTLPMAVPFDTVVALSSVGDHHVGPVTVDAAGFGRVTIDPLRLHDTDIGSYPDWARHLLGCVALLGASGIPAGGWRATIDTDIPTGASLSSSAALEVAVIRAVLARAGTTWTPIEVARLGRRVEHEFVGVPCGIMDQLISAGATVGSASLMDCRLLRLDPVRLPQDVVVAVMDTGTRRVLAEVAYGERRAACERAAAALGVVALRDVRPVDLDRIAAPVDRRRAHHVVTENDRTLAAAAALRSGDVATAGRLMDESHDSLRDDFEVSGPGLDAIVEIARAAPGCLGSRMTGGGFAGCAVALVRAEMADSFTAAIIDRYDHDGHRATVWICTPADGASVDQPDGSTP